MASGSGVGDLPFILLSDSRMTVSMLGGACWWVVSSGAVAVCVCPHTLPCVDQALLGHACTGPSGS
jgi:hypothetical protein